MQFTFSDQTIVVNISDKQTLLADVRQRFQGAKGFALATINLDHLVKLRKSPGYRAAYAKQDLVVADGNPIVWLSRIAGRHVDLVTGSDLLIPVLALAAEEKVSVALYGATPDVLTNAAEKLRDRIPGLAIVWTGSPPMGFDPQGEEAQVALAAMQQAGVGLCIICLSPPRQETFAALGRTATPTIGFCSFGAGLDFVVGRQVRAPRWVQTLAMEWAWRALSSPRRLIPRYAACAAILPGQAIAALRLRLRGK